MPSFGAHVGTDAQVFIPICVMADIARLRKESCVVLVVPGASINNGAVPFGSSPDLRFRPACPLTVRRAFEGQNSHLHFRCFQTATRQDYHILICREVRRQE